MLRELEEAVQQQFQVSDAPAAATTTDVAKDWESRLHISQVRTISRMSLGVVYDVYVILLFINL